MDEAICTHPRTTNEPNGNTICINCEEVIKRWASESNRIINAHLLETDLKSELVNLYGKTHNESFCEGYNKGYIVGKYDGCFENAVDNRKIYNHFKKFLFLGGFIIGSLLTSVIQSFFR